MQIILYIENLKDFTKRLLKTNKHNKIARYKINIQKPFAFLHSNNEVAGREINKSIYHCIKNEVKYMEINLSKEVKYLYTENHRTLMNETEATYKLRYFILMHWNN